MADPYQLLCPRNGGRRGGGAWGCTDLWIQDYRGIGEKSRSSRYQYVTFYLWIDLWHFACSATVKQNCILSLLAAGFPAGREPKPGGNGGHTASTSQSSTSGATWEETPLQNHYLTKLNKICLCFKCIFLKKKQTKPVFSQRNVTEK